MRTGREINRRNRPHHGSSAKKTSLSQSSFNFHDSKLVAFSVGPRKEVKLHVALDPVWNDNEAKTVVVRLAAIENMPQVAVFFEAMTPSSDPNRFIAEVIDFSQSKKDFVDFELSGYGQIQIHSKKIYLS